MATRDSMNMGSSRTSNIIFEAKAGISGMRQEASLLNQTLESTRSIVGSISDKLKNAFGGGGGGEGGTNQVAPNPVFSSAQGGAAAGLSADAGPAAIAAGPSAPIVGGSGFGGGTNLTSFVSERGGGTLYQSETGGGGGGGGGGGRGLFGGGGSDSGSTTSRISNMLGVAGSVVSGLFAGYNIAADLMPATSDILEAQLLQQRARFFGGKDVTNTQQNVAAAAMLSGDNPQMDVLRAQIAAQSYGLAGGNVNQLMMGAARVSNLMPGVGVEGAIRATGAMQQAYNVNMLRGIGIQIRNADGSLKPIDQVIDDIWQKICRDFSQSGQGAAPTLQQVQISLQPGNALDSMLNQYFGNDPMLKQLVANGLIYRAQSGAGTVSTLTKKSVLDLGGTTQAMLQFTQTAAAGQALITSEAAITGAEAGFTRGSEYVQNFYNNLRGEFAGLTQSILSLKGSLDTMLTAFNGNMFSVLASFSINSIGGLIDFLSDKLSPSTNQKNNPLSDLFTNPSTITSIYPGMAAGGPVDSGMPYIIGEEGPELFVPKSSGTIVPNNKLSSGDTYNFTVNVANGNGPEVVAAIKNLINELETSKRISES